MFGRREFLRRTLAGAVAVIPGVKLLTAIPAVTKAALSPGLRNVPISAITLNPAFNMRASLPYHDNPYLEALKQSIREMGMLNPVTVNARGELVSGHARLAAMKQLGATEIMADVRPEFDTEAAAFMATLVSNSLPTRNAWGGSEDAEEEWENEDEYEEEDDWDEEDDDDLDDDEDEDDDEEGD